MLEKNEIAQMAQEMTTVQDLLDLLNLIKIDEEERQGLPNKYPFTRKQIYRYCNPQKNKQRRYVEFKIRKKSGGERTISAPKTATYMLLLRSVNRLLQAVYTPSVHAMGFVEGRSVVQNASAHTGKNYVLNLDLENFFPSIPQARVWKRLQVKPFCFNQDIANIVAGLCCIATEEQDEKGYYKCVLPQGAPTSPTLTNAICDRLDRKLSRLAKHHGLSYTRYADDITFSSMHNVYQSGSDFNKELHSIIAEESFVVNKDKTRLQKLGSRQEVTGLVVSGKVNVTKEYEGSIRNLLHIWEKFGYLAARTRFLKKYAADKPNKKGAPDMISVLEGKLLYMRMVKGESDKVYKRLNERFQALADKVRSTSHTNKNKITVRQTVSVEEFEQTTRSVLTLLATEEGNQRPKAVFAGEDSQQDVVLKLNLTDEDLQHKEKLQVSDCVDQEGNNFEIIHSSNRPIAPPEKPVDIQKLIVELENLLDK